MDRPVRGRRRQHDMRIAWDRTSPSGRPGMANCSPSARSVYSSLQSSFLACVCPCCLLRLHLFVAPAAMAANTSRGSLSSGIPTASAEFSTCGDGSESTSSASPRYRGTPSTPISTLGGFRKWVFSKYSGLMSRDASSG
jgi:hypothetical protein